MTSKLVIYYIDHLSKPYSQNSKNREDLNATDDLIGIFILIPGGKKEQNYLESLKVQINHLNNDIDVEDEEGK